MPVEVFDVVHIEIAAVRTHADVVRVAERGLVCCAVVRI
jgi:hypothetical protein|tara:strand:- start:1091 stop:1207 length:117 start_codon:yes stop_codon:yes gene_type:complete